MSGDPSKLIVGTWKSEIGGFPVTHHYDENTVRVVGYDAVPYHLEDDLLTLDSEGGSDRVVSFPSGSEMLQTDPLTGSVRTFSRVE